MNNRYNTTEFTRGAMIAGLYALLSLAFAPLSYGLVQIRFSEALTVMPRYSKSAVFGLFTGCLIANAAGMAFGLTMLPDVFVGSLATLAAAAMSYALRANRWLVPLPPVIINAVLVGWLLCSVYNVGAPLYACMLYVGAGQLVSCYALGIPLTYALDKIHLFDCNKSAS